METDDHLTPCDDPTSSTRFWRELRSGDALVHPRRVGPFVIQGIIGSGAYGIVYRAEQQRPRRTVALKLLRPGIVTADALKRFELEAFVLARLRHPGIAQVYETGQTDFGIGPQPYCAMELVEGRSITAYAREEALSTRDKVALLSRLCDAVQHAHQNGVVHRDLSPSNVLVEVGGRPRVVDFGIARLTTPQERPVSLRTVTGRVLGTLPYASPEQLRGRSDGVDARADVYGLGALGFELLTGHPPHDVRGLGPADALRRVTDGEPRRAGTFDRTLRGDLETILAKALAADRARRYPSAADLGADLARWLRGAPIAARPASLAYLFRRFASRHRGLVVGLSLALLALVGGFAGTFAALLRARRAEAGLESRVASAERELEFLLDYALNVLVPRVGPGEVQRPLLQQLVQRIESRLEESPGDPGLRASLARVLAAQAMLETRRNQMAEAVALEQRALRLREDLLAQMPSDLELRREISVSWARIGDLARRRAALDESLHWYRRTLAQDERLVIEHPENPRLWDDLSWSLERTAFALRELGSPEEARPLILRRHDIAQDLATWDPDTRKARHNLCASHSWMAELAKDSGDTEGLLHHARERVRLAGSLVADAPEDRTYVLLLARSNASLARAQHEAGFLQDAERSMRSSVQSMRALMELDPADGELLDVGGRGMVRQFAAILRDQGRVDEAVQVLRETLQLGTHLAQSAPAAIGPLRVQALALLELARSAPDGVAVHRQEALRLHAAIAAHEDAVPLDHLRYAQALLEFGEGAAAPALALAAAERACAAAPPVPGAERTLERARLRLHGLEGPE